MQFNEALDKLWPKAKQSVRNAVKAIANEQFEENHMNTLEICHFMAQISHECGGGVVVRENMNYSAERLLEIFGVGKHSARVTPAEAQRLAHRPQEIAERVYGLGNPKKAKELGNTRPGDGWRFRGGGMLQLTGGANYERVGEETGYDLYNNPEQLENPTTSFKVALAEFIELGCLDPASRDNVNAVTKRVNGGTNGLAERKVWLRKWKTALDGVEADAWAPRAAELDESPKLLQTRTGQLGTAASGLGVVSAVSQVGENLSTVTDTVTSVQDNAVQVIHTVKVAKTFLGLSPQMWNLLGICAVVLMIVCIAGVLVYRAIKIREQGV
jgi:putative chitinase